MQSTHILPRQQLDKIASTTSMTKMGPRPDRWVEEVLQKLYEEHPYLSEYQVQGKLTHSEPEKLYGLGYIEVRTPTESRQKQPAARIPFIIENGMLHPPKVFLDPTGKADLMDKDIFATAMFSAAPSLSLADRVMAPSLVDHFRAPEQFRQGFLGGGIIGQSESAKLSSVQKEALDPHAVAALVGGGYGAGTEGLPGAAGGAAGGAGGYAAGRFLGQALGYGLGKRLGFDPETAGKVGGHIGGVGGGLAGSLGGIALAKRLFPGQPDMQYQDVNDYYKTGAAAPSLGEDAETLLRKEGVALSEEERVLMHRHAMKKLAEVPGSISMLEQISHAIDVNDQLRVAERIQQEKLAQHFVDNGFQGLVTMALSVRPEKTAAREATDVVQVLRVGNGRYQVKRANVDGFEPATDVVSVRDIGSMVGEDLVPQINQEGRVTITTQPAVQENLEDRRIEDIQDYGIWKVQALDGGHHIIGWVITNVIDFHMNSMPLKLFTNGDVYALQEHLAGVRVAMGQALPRKEIKVHDLGVFYYADHSGRATCTIPVTITSIVDQNGETVYGCVDTWGKPYHLTYGPRLKKLVDLGEKGIAIPDTMQWMPLYQEVKIVPNAELMSKMAAVEQIPETLEILCDQQSFSFRGAPVIKLAAEDKHFLDEPSAEFMLVAMGVPVDRARVKMAEAYLHGTTKISGVRTLRTKQERREKIASIERSIRSKCDTSQLRKDTVKIAAELPDYAPPASVDAVLSLNFITPENLSLFVENLPHLEAARRDLSELYLASCLGLPDVPRPALLRAAEALKDVTQGLVKVKMRAMLV